MKNKRSVQSLSGFACLMLLLYHVVGIVSGLLGPAALRHAIALPPFLSQWLVGVCAVRQQQQALAVATTAQLANQHHD